MRGGFRFLFSRKSVFLGHPTTHQIHVFNSVFCWIGEHIWYKHCYISQIHKMRTFIENYLHFMKNCIRPPYKKLKSGFIENSNFENNRDPCI